MKPFIVIPARYQSSRFCGKPLAEISGKPMIRWVAERKSAAYGSDRVIVATDSNEIMHEMSDFQCIMTSEKCKTGTDRVAEVVEKIECCSDDVFINVQGDEPLIDPIDIKNIFETKLLDRRSVVSGMSTKQHSLEIGNDRKIVKLVVGQNNYLMYASRHDIPFSKTQKDTFLKHVGIFAFSKWQLEKFACQKDKTLCESTEEIELLRFLELGIKVRMC